MDKYDQALVLLSIVFSIVGTWLFDSGNFGPLQARAHKKQRQAWSFGLLSVGFALGAISFFWS